MHTKLFTNYAVKMILWRIINALAHTKICIYGLISLVNSNKLF